MSDLWSITIPGYLTGAGTILLVIVTAAVLRRDRQRDKLQALHSARKVFAVAVERRGHIEGGDSVRTTHALMLVNASDEPIFEVSAYTPNLDSELGEVGISFVHGSHESSRRFVLPGERAYLNGQWVKFVDGKFTRAETKYWMFEQLPVKIAWMDGAGRLWQRTQSQEPIRRKPGESVI